MPFYPNTAVASIQGGPLAPSIRGNVFFQDVPNGTMIYADISGLPAYQPVGNSGKRLACGVIQSYGSQFYSTEYYGSQTGGGYY